MPQELHQIAIKNNPKIGIVGFGYVGNAVYYWFKNVFDKPVEIFLYDKYKGVGSIEDINNNAEIIFVCVPTPYEEKIGYDNSAVIETLKSLSNPKTIIIKSTVLPGTTEGFQKRFPIHKIVFNPEFLTTKNAATDFINPSRQIIGYTDKSKDIATSVMEILPKAPFVKLMPSTEAELVKYFGNAFLAMKVIFANQFYDLCVRLGANYNTIREAASADFRIGNNHLEIFSDGYRGYGGTCLPKDTKALIDFAKSLGIPLTLLEEVDSVNNNLQSKNI